MTFRTFRILCGNTDFSAFSHGRKSFFHLCGEVNLLIFPRGKQKGRFFFLLNLALFLPSVMTFFQKNKRRDHSD